MLMEGGEIIEVYAFNVIVTIRSYHYHIDSTITIIIITVTIFIISTIIN